jgi:glycosyltransferase involved in cell wall biosynthesis
MSNLNKKSILFVINSLEGGGAERVICNLLEIMRPTFERNQCKVQLVLLDTEEERQKCPDYVTKTVLNAKGKLLPSYSQLREYLERNPTDAIVSFLTRSNIVSVHLGKKLNIPVAISERVNTTSHFSTSRFGFVSKLMIGYFYPKATCIVPVSDGVMQDLIDNFHVEPKQCKVLYNAYDTDKLTEIAEIPCTDIPTRPYIVAIGRLVKNKNFPLAIRAFARSKSLKDFVIIGQGEEFEKLQEVATIEGVKSRVHFLGFKQNPYPYIKHADYLLSSSNAEGFPNGIVEAMCLGVPVIATNCPSGPAEILTGDHRFETDGFASEKYGLICQTENQSAMIDAIDTLENDGGIDLYKQRSLARAKMYSYDNMINTFTQILSSLTFKS